MSKINYLSFKFICRKSRITELNSSEEEDSIASLNLIIYKLIKQIYIKSDFSKICHWIKWRARQPNRCNANIQSQMLSLKEDNYCVES